MHNSFSRKADQLIGAFFDKFIKAAFRDKGIRVNCICPGRRH